MAPFAGPTDITANMAEEFQTGHALPKNLNQQKVDVSVFLRRRQTISPYLFY